MKYLIYLGVLLTGISFYSNSNEFIHLTTNKEIVTPAMLTQMYYAITAAMAFVVTLLLLRDTE